MRASYYMETVKKPENDNEALATALSVIRSVSVPVGITTPGQPNIASTQWRTMADQRNKLYFFESAFSPYLFWVDLTRLTSRPGPVPASSTSPISRSSSWTASSCLERYPTTSSRLHPSCLATEPAPVMEERRLRRSGAGI